jgi:hypothetical protein
VTDREEFERARKRLYALADRMGMKLVIIVRRKNPFAPEKMPKPERPAQRQPGEE